MRPIKFADLMVNPAGLLPFVDRVVNKVEINRCCSRSAVFETRELARREELSSMLDAMRIFAQRETEILDGIGIPLVDLVTHILDRYHRPLGVRLLNLETLIDMVMESHRGEIADQTNRIKETYISLRRELLPHLLQEEDVLFPWILSGNGRGAVELIDDLSVQHKVIAMKTKTIAALTSRIPMSESPCEGRPALYTTIKALETGVFEHIHVENNILYNLVLGESGSRVNGQRLDSRSRRRRSAQRFDDKGCISREVLFALLDKTIPRSNMPPFDIGLGPTCVDLVLFVHRVTGLEPGLYLLLRSGAPEDSLKQRMHREFEWKRVDPALPLFLLKAGNLEEVAAAASCLQDIAGACAAASASLFSA